MKRITAFFFLMIANLVLLAHVVIPHHHHQNVACINNTHCQDDIVAHEHNTTGHDHQHDGNGSDNCILKQAVIVPSNQGKNEADCIFWSYNHSLDYHFTLPYTGNEDLNQVFYIVASLPDLSFSFLYCITSSSGLRGPPLV
jgi:hypothetical protein